MSLAGKIKISFATIVIFPITMILLFIIAIGKYQVSTIEEEYEIEIDDWRMIFDGTRMTDYLTDIIRNEIKEMSETEDFKIKDKEMWENRQRKFDKEQFGVIVISDGEILYTSVPEIKKIAKMLPDYDDVEENGVFCYYIGDTEKYLVKPQMVKGEDGKGVAYVIALTGFVPIQGRKFVFEMIIVLLLLLIFTGAALVVYLNKCVLVPINNLKKATENIIGGNLDASTQYDGTEEFDSLYYSFEKMRLHLKQSIESNLTKELESRELISNISHDLKTPITAIKGYVEGIMDGVADTDEKMDRYIRTIYNKANDMDRLIGELTVYSKIDTGIEPYRFVKLNVAEYFDDCIDEIGTELENKSFKLSYANYTDRGTEVIADPEQIRRVINNIINNSIKYNDKKEGIINIRIKDQKGYVHFEIEDNGKGVDSDELPYIFERFYRTDSSRNTKNGGSGIGLSIVKKIIEAHGGSIWAFSEKGEGLSIHFILEKAEHLEAEKKLENEKESDGDRIYGKSKRIKRRKRRERKRKDGEKTKKHTNHRR